MGGLPINQLDFIFGLILVILLLRGLYNGFIREIASIVGLFIGLFLASRLYKSVVPLAERFIEDQAYAQIASYVVVLAGTFLVVLIALAILRNIFHMTLLGGVDRFAGGFMTAFLPADNESLTKSRIAPQINKITSSIATFLPQDMREDIRAKGSYLHEMWNKDWADELRRKHHKEPIK
jgi:membrane protein required for colicin V production